MIAAEMVSASARWESNPHPHQRRWNCRDGDLVLNVHERDKRLNKWDICGANGENMIVNTQMDHRWPDFPIDNRKESWRGRGLRPVPGDRRLVSGHVFWRESGGTFSFSANPPLI